MSHECVDLKPAEGVGVVVAGDVDHFFGECVGLLVAGGSIQVARLSPGLALTSQDFLVV